MGSRFTLASDADYTTGGAWGADGRITFGRGGALWQVPAAGGAATQLTTLDAGKGELLHAFPTAVGDGNAILFATVDRPRPRRIAHRKRCHAAQTRPGARKWSVPVPTPVYVARGHLIFSRDDLLLAVPFDEERLQVTGAAVRVANQVGLTPIGVPMFAVSRSGSLAYIERNRGHPARLGHTARQ